MRFFYTCCLFLTTFNCAAHDFFYSFAEVEYKRSSGVIETTLIVTTHDFEQYLRKLGWSQKDLASAKTDSISLTFIEKEINNHLMLSSDLHEAIHMKLIGYENQLIGTTQFYLTTQIEPIQMLDFKFDLLMDLYPQQQNKINFTMRETDLKTTLEFLPSSKIQRIDLY